MSWAVLGAYAALVRGEELGGGQWDDADSDDAEPEDGIEGVFPRLRIKGRIIVPCGIWGWSKIYMDESGNFIECDIRTGEVFTLPQELIVYLESTLLHMERKQMAGASALWTKEFVDPGLPELLGLDPAGYATDTYESWWEGRSGEALLVQGGTLRETRLTTNVSALLDLAAEYLRRRGIPFSEHRR